MTTTTYAADRTALLIVDPYNDFMSEGGKFYESTKETAEAVGFYDNMRRLIPAIRAARIQVIIVPHHRWREGDYVGWKHMNPTQVRANQSHGFAAGTWGGEFHPEFGPRDGDVVVLEHWGQSGFANTDLDAQFTQRGIEKIILVGFVANTCVEGTARFDDRIQGRSHKARRIRRRDARRARDAAAQRCIFLGAASRLGAAHALSRILHGRILDRAPAPA